MVYLREREREENGSPCLKLNGEKEREMWKKKSPSLVVGVAYIECATHTPLMLHGGASMP